MEKILAYIAISICVMASIAVCELQQIQPRVEELQATIAQIATEAKGFDEPRARIEKLPRNETIVAVVDALDKGIYREERTRSFAYWVLAILDGVSTESGYTQLLECLDESPSLLGLCANALSKAPPEKLPDVAERLMAFFTAETVTPGDQETLLKAITKIGKHAGKHIGPIEEVLSDPDGNDRIRSFAAAAVFNIGGAERAVEILSKLDSAGLKASMGPLATFAGESKGTLGTDDKAVRAKVRAFIRECTRDPDREIRETGIHALILAYTKDEGLVGNAADGYRIIPEVREAFEFMAQNDPLEELRIKARHLLERSDEELRDEGKTHRYHP